MYSRKTLHNKINFCVGGRIRNLTERNDSSLVDLSDTVDVIFVHDVEEIRLNTSHNCNPTEKNNNNKVPFFL